jgi:hypothetical protein
MVGPNFGLVTLMYNLKGNLFWFNIGRSVIHVFDNNRVYVMSVDMKCEHGYKYELICMYVCMYVCIEYGLKTEVCL